MTDAEKIIQDQLDGDITKRGTVAFQEFFGERCVAALCDAGLLPGPGDSLTDFAIQWDDGDMDNGYGSAEAAQAAIDILGQDGPAGSNGTATVVKRTLSTIVGPWVPVDRETENG